MILLDTNVLGYAVNADVPQHRASHAAVQAALDGRIPAVLFPQILLEFFAIITHPRRVLAPLDPVRAWETTARLSSGISVLDPPATLTALGEVIRAIRPIGGGVFDLFLVAQMRAHGVETICTYNGQDFARQPGVEAIAPKDLLAGHGDQF